jgi:hypothetical protein
MDIKEKIREQYGFNLPISGGDGRSADEPVCLELTKLNNYVLTEKLYIAIILKDKCKDWKMKFQSLNLINERYIDYLNIEVIGHDETRSRQVFWFDVTECLKKKTEDFFEGLEDSDISTLLS